jgi:hypothetical protein
MVRRHIAASVRREVFARDKYRCVYCGSDQYLQVDHYQPVFAGGSNDILNLKTACRSCNARKGHNEPDWRQCTGNEQWCHEESWDSMWCRMWSEWNALNPNVSARAYDDGFYATREAVDAALRNRGVTCQ